MSTKTKANEIQWRRSKILELRGLGLTYAEIALELQVSRTCIVADANHLRDLKLHIDGRKPQGFIEL